VRARQAVTDSLVKQPGRQASAFREMLGTRPPSVLSASKSSRRVKRRKALVRNAAPVGHLAVRPVPSTEGTAGPSRGPARLTALHRGDFRGASLHTLGPRFPLRATARSPGGPAGTLHTGRIARRFDTRGAPRARLVRPDPQTPLPAPPNEHHALMPSNEQGCLFLERKENMSTVRPRSPRCLVC
jgi:hypothetical protein